MGDPRGKPDTTKNDDARIAGIKGAASDEQLERAIRGYREQALATHPALRKNAAFIGAMDTGQYFRALEHLRAAASPDRPEYADVIRVLEFAVTRALAIKLS